MRKKTLLFISFFVVLVFFPIMRVSATQVYVGVQITATEPIKSDGTIDPGVLWCLPTGTTMGIMSGTSYITPVSPTVNPVTTILPTCPGSTIWSGLLNLTSGTTYTIRIAPQPGYFTFCSGYNYGGYCYETWDVAGQNKNCYEICAHYGQTPVVSGTRCYNTLLNCNTIEKLKGSPCIGGPSCSTGCCSGSYSYYSKTTNECWYYSGWGPDNGCYWSDPNYVRACICNVNSTLANLIFDLSFIP